MKKFKDDDLLEVTGEERIVIPDGEYEVVFVGRDNKFFFGQQKIYLKFKIISFGEFNERQLFKSYNIYEGLNKQSYLAKDIEIVLNRRIRKKERISINNSFKNKILKVRTRTVKKDRKQNILPEFQRYSVIDKIISVVMGSK